MESEEKQLCSRSKSEPEIETKLVHLPREIRWIVKRIFWKSAVFI